MATNFKHKGKVITMATADGAVSGQPFVLGNFMPGVLISNAGADPYPAPVRVEGIFSLSCKAHDGGSNSKINVGEAVYWNAVNEPLDKNSSQKFFGIALEEVASGQTASINVYITPKMAVPFTFDVNVIQHAQVALTSANIKAMYTTPVQIVATPGADKAIEFISAVIHYDYDGEDAYTGGGNVTFKIADGETVSQVISSANSFAAAEDKLTGCVMLDTAGGIPLTANKALQITNGTEAFGGSGTGTATVYVSYRVLDLS